MKTKIVLTYCNKDYLLAFYAARMLIRKTEINGSNLLFYRSRFAIDPPKEFQERYKSGTIICQTDKKDYPAGTNHMFAKLMGLYREGKLDCERLILLEPDSYPTKYNWASRILSEHEQGGKPVSGSLVDWGNNKVTFPDHINGNLIIDRSFVLDNPVLCRETIMPWDTFHAELILNNASVNKELLNIRRHTEQYPTAFWATQKAAWCHGCQNFQMYDYMNQRTFWPKPQFDPDSDMSVFIRSYDKDLDWLEACLGTFAVYGSGYKEIVLCGDGKTDSGVKNLANIFGIKYVCDSESAEIKQGYIGQQFSKLKAYEWCSGDYILFVDSDCISTRPHAPETWLEKKKPIILHSPWEACEDAKNVWYESTKELTGIDPPYEFMRRLPLCYFKEDLKQLEENHQLKEVCREATRISEFNCIGNLLWASLKDNYVWYDPSEKEIPNPIVQKWSHGDFNEMKPAINNAWRYHQRNT